MEVNKSWPPPLQSGPTFRLAWSTSQPAPRGTGRSPASTLWGARVPSLVCGCVGQTEEAGGAGLPAQWETQV